MKSMLTVSITLAAMLAGPCAAMNLIPESLVVARDDTTAYTYEGCFKSAGNLMLNGTNLYQSKKTCHDTCVPLGASVEATANKNECWCGNALPATADKVDDSQCNANCTGYPQEMCMFPCNTNIKALLTYSQVAAPVPFLSILLE